MRHDWRVWRQRERRDQHRCRHCSNRDRREPHRRRVLRGDGPPDRPAFPDRRLEPDGDQGDLHQAAGWFEQANTAAPAAIAGDVAAYKTAYDEYVRYLSTVDFNLNIVFSTPQGTQLAIDTSHTLTPAIVQYAVDDCGLSFGDEQQPPSSTT